jgi:predicted metal-dependent peptidase
VKKHELLVSQAKVKLIRSQPFFAAILLKRQIMWTDQIPTGAIDKNANIILNPKFVEALTVDQCVWLLCHEVCHVAYMHFARQGTRDQLRWNIAADAVINDTLKEAYIGQVIPNCVDMPGSHAETSEAIYNKLPQLQQKNIYMDCGALGQDLPKDGNDPNSPEGKAQAAQIKLDIAGAAAIAKAAGKMPGVLSEWVDKLLAEKVEWHKILEQYMNQLCKSPMQSWSRPNKRFRHIAYLPSTFKEPQLNFLVVQLDVSGSITSELMAKYISHIENIIGQCSPQKTLILWTDTEVRHTQTIEYPEQPDIDHFCTYGGTDMEDGFRWLNENEPDNPDAFICITDGMTPFTTAPDFPVVWVMDSPYGKVTAPYGTTIQIEKD